MQVALIGDSVIDNDPYVRRGEDVTSHLRALGEGHIFTKLALDGSVTSSALAQAYQVAPSTDAVVLSSGGNDALMHSDKLIDPASMNFGQAMVVAQQVREQFRADYGRLVRQLLALGKPVLALTIYNPRFNLDGEDTGMQAAAEGALSLFNDVIQQEATAAGFALLDTRPLCSSDEDFANPIEPSEIGGRRIAEGILSWVNGLAAAEKSAT